MVYMTKNPYPDQELGAGFAGIDCDKCDANVNINSGFYHCKTCDTDFCKKCCQPQKVNCPTCTMEQAATNTICEMCESPIPKLPYQIPKNARDFQARGEDEENKNMQMDPPPNAAINSSYVAPDEEKFPVFDPQSANPLPQFRERLETEILNQERMRQARLAALTRNKKD